MVYYHNNMNEYQTHSETRSEARPTLRSEARPTLGSEAKLNSRFELNVDDEMRFSIGSRIKYNSKSRFMRGNRDKLIDSIPLYSDNITVFAEAKLGRIKRRRSKLSNCNYIETVVLTNVSFDGVSFSHIWVTLNDNLRSIPFGTRIEFRARTYQYKRRDGTYSLGLRKIDLVKIKNLSPVNNWRSINNSSPCRTESIVPTDATRYAVD